MYYIVVVLLFMLGLILIIKGGDYFVEAASWIAEVSGIPKFIIGATIVSIATTMPELIVSLFATISGKIDIATGNAIGSVTANSGIIMGISIICMPAAIKSKNYITKALMLITSISVLYIFSLKGKLNYIGCIILAVIFILFIFENIKSAKNTSSNERLKVKSKSEIYSNIVKFILGCAGIILGANLLVNNGTVIAKMLHVPESIIAVTMIAIGTSLPELITTLTAIKKKQASLSAGNIIGANIIDTTLILPICSLAAKKPLAVSTQSLLFDIPICLLITSIILIPTLMKSKFSKWQGITTLVIYFLYVIGIVNFTK